MSRRFLIFVLAGLLLGGLVAAVFTLRRPVGAIPGDTPVLGLGAVEGAFLVGSDSGLFVSTDGVEWGTNPRFEGMRVLVASAGGTAVLRTGDGTGVTMRTTDLDDLTEVEDPAPLGTGLAVGPDGVVYVAISDSVEPLFSVDAEGDVDILYQGEEGPREILALSVVPVPGGLRLLAGGLVAGLWEFSLGPSGTAQAWRRLNALPVTAVTVDPDDTDRLLMGTPGGLLVSEDSGRSWAFTDLRSGVLGLTERDGRFWAVIDDRILMGSGDGASGWEAAGS